MKRPPELYFLCLLLLLLSVNALIGGILMVLEPEGSMLGMDPAWIHRTPFKDYLLPGAILFIFNGLFPLFTLVGLLMKPDWKWAQFFNIYAYQYWAWTYSLFCGIILISWITIQLALTQYFWLQPVLIGIGLLIIIFTMLPRIMKYYNITATTKKDLFASNKVIFFPDNFSH